MSHLVCVSPGFSLDVACIFQYKEKISESELKEVSETQAKVAVEKLDKLVDKAEVNIIKIFFVYYILNKEI